MFCFILLATARDVQWTGFRVGGLVFVFVCLVEENMYNSPPTQNSLSIPEMRLGVLSRENLTSGR